MQGRTTYAHFHTVFPVDAKTPRRQWPAPTGVVDNASFDIDMHTTTNAATYVPHPVTRVPGPTTGVAGPPLPWMASAPTTQETHAWQMPPPLKSVPAEGAKPQMAFGGKTEYQQEFVPKEPRPFLPHLAGMPL